MDYNYLLLKLQDYDTHEYIKHLIPIITTIIHHPNKYFKLDTIKNKNFISLTSIYIGTMSVRIIKEHERIYKIINDYDGIFIFYKINILRLNFFTKYYLREQFTFLLHHGYNNIYLYKKTNNHDKYLYSKAYVLNYL